MKKRISILLITILLTLCLGVGAFAEQIKAEVSFNDDFTKMYFNGKTFSRVNASSLDYDYVFEIVDDVVYDDGVYTDASSYPYYGDEGYDVIPNPAHTNVDDFFVYSNAQQTLFFADITYKDGATLTCAFLREDYQAEYNKITSGQTETLTVDFFWPEENQVIVNASSLKTGSSSKINYYSSMEFEVYAEAKDKSFRAVVGLVYESNENFYYLDFEKSGITYDDYMYGDYDMDEYITVTKIEDETTIQLLNEGLEKYYEDEMGFVYDDELSQSVSKVFFFITLIIFPLLICIASLVLLIKSKKPAYKKVFATICILSLLEIIAVVIVVLLYNKFV